MIVKKIYIHDGAEVLEGSGKGSGRIHGLISERVGASDFEICEGCRTSPPPWCVRAGCGGEGEIERDIGAIIFVGVGHIVVVVIVIVVVVVVGGGGNGDGSSVSLFIL